MSDLKLAIEKRRKVSFWGADRFITPRMIDEVFGDGKRLIGIQPLMTRPNYYVIQGDSAWDSRFRETDLWIDVLEDKICRAIDCQFGNRNDEEHYNRGSVRWPVSTIDDGSCWFEIQNPLKSKGDPK